MTKYHVIGKGRWGKKVDSCLKQLGTPVNELDKADWVFICSPNTFHYEYCVNAIQQRKNVFCEKPLALCHKQVSSVFDLASKNNVRLYIDDVFNWKDLDILSGGNRFVWRKRNLRGFLERLAFHHFYLWLSKNPSAIASISWDGISLKVTLSDGSVSEFQYRSGPDFHEINGRLVDTDDGALPSMLAAVISGTADFESNRVNSLRAAELLGLARQHCYERVAVVGAGIFGATAAIELSNNGYVVDLFEGQKDVMSGASGINQYRVHRGYHYPRSYDTAKECQNSEDLFLKYYRNCLKDENIEHIYGIQSTGSLISKQEYQEFLNLANLEYSEIEPLPGCDYSIRAEELLYDPSTLREIVKSRLATSSVNLNLSRTIREDEMPWITEKYDKVILANYAALNKLASVKKKYQFEVVEKPVVKLPELFHKKSIVIMDGPFGCLDPFGDCFVLGHVVHAIHSTNIGHFPIVPTRLRRLLNRGIIKSPSVTHIDRFKSAGVKLFGPEFRNLEHVGSMYTIRTVLADRDHDDARPTLVEKVGDNVWTMFSGKVITCVTAARLLLHEFEAN